MRSTMTEGEEPNLNFWKKPRFRATFVHIGLVATCITYIVFGAYLFQAIERPIELEMNKKALSVFHKINSEFLSKIEEEDQNIEQIVDDYIENMLLLFENTHYAHVFETEFTNQTTDKDIWTFPAAVLFTTTTIIPVGYGNVCPSSELGKILLIIYGIIGIPLALVTVANTGKFVSRMVSVWFDESMTLLTGLFLSLLFFYPIFGGLLFHSYADLSLRDAIYFSFTSIFMIGFGDLMPNVNVVYLVVFIIVGVLLVTITIDFVVAEVIDHIHYMGRHVGKARMMASKMIHMAQSLNVNRGISGITAAGMNQLQAFARLGLLGKVDRKALEKNIRECAFAPFLEDMDFMDNVPACSLNDTPSRHRKPPNRITL